MTSKTLCGKCKAKPYNTIDRDEKFHFVCYIDQNEMVCGVRNCAQIQSICLHSQQKSIESFGKVLMRKQI